jgi:hypothetical protein
MNYLIVNTLDKNCREFLEKEDVSAYQVIDWYKDDLSKVQSLGLSVSSFPCAFINFPDTGGLPEAYEVVSEFNSVSELQEKTANRSEERNKEGESLPPLPPQPNVELFLGTLKLDPKYPLELLPYLALWSPADILNEQSRKGFWAKVKDSKPYFMAPEIIQSVEQLAVQCNLPLE